ncbi:MAG: molybdopterin-dependent oxidoreductase, partial [Acidobacteria bacterium]|nr:molybdopterin-dependent oxidoreductase [Acidobacteriota bacterium]
MDRALVRRAGAVIAEGPRARPVLPAPACRAGCCSRAWVAPGDRWLGLEGDDGWPACDDCIAAARVASDPGRPAAPLSRDPGRDEPLVPVRWDEAHDRLAAALSDAAAGRARLVWIRGSRRPRLSDAMARRVAHFVPGSRLLRAAGARAGTARAFAGRLGPGDQASPESIEAADLLIAWGVDPIRLPRAEAFAWRRAGERGVPRLVVDPCAAAAGGGPSIQLGIWPGTDVAVALALLRMLSAGGSGRSALDDALQTELERWTPARAAEIARRPERELADAASLLGRAQRAVILVGGGVARHGEGPAAAAALIALARSFGARLAVPAVDPDPAMLLPFPVGAPPLEEAAPSGWGAPGLPDDARRLVLIVEGAEQMAGRGGWRALERLVRTARHSVVLGTRPGALAQAASLYLPIAGHLEQEDVVGSNGRLWRGEAARPAPRGALPTATLLRAVTRRLGWPERWFPAEPAAWVAEAENRPAPAPAVARAPARPVLRETGEGPRTTPALYDRFPLALVGGRRDERSTAAIVPGEPPTLLVAPKDAASRGLADGEVATVANERGRLAVRVRCAAEQPTGVVAVLDGSTEAPGELGRLFPDPTGSG